MIFSERVNETSIVKHNLPFHFIEKLIIHHFDFLFLRLFTRLHFAIRSTLLLIKLQQPLYSHKSRHFSIRDRSSKPAKFEPLRDEIALCNTKKQPWSNNRSKEEEKKSQKEKSNRFRNFAKINLLWNGGWLTTVCHAWNFDIFGRADRESRRCD